MPHISHSDREIYDYSLNKLSTLMEGVPVGHLTYVLYVLALRWMNSHPSFARLPDFARRLQALGALNEAQHELRRIHLADYEDEKIRNNGEAQ